MRGIIGYTLLFIAWYNIVPDTSTNFLWFERVSIAISLIIMVLFSGNYLGVLDKIRISSIRPQWLRIAVIAIADILIFALSALLVGMIEGLILLLL